MTLKGLKIPRHPIPSIKADTLLHIAPQMDMHSLLQLSGM